MNLKKCFVLSIIFVSMFLLIIPTFPLPFEIYIPQSILPYASVPHDLQPGDILFCDVRPIIFKTFQDIDFFRVERISGFSNDHCMMYIGNNKFIEACPYYKSFTNDTWTGVVITPFEVVSIWATNISYGFVNISQEIKNKAVEYAKDKLGQPYGYNGFLCGYLIYDSYESQGITFESYYYSARYPNGLRNAQQISVFNMN